MTVNKHLKTFEDDAFIIPELIKLILSNNRNHKLHNSNLLTFLKDASTFNAHPLQKITKGVCIVLGIYMLFFLSLAFRNDTFIIF